MTPDNDGLDDLGKIVAIIFAIAVIALGVGLWGCAR